MEDRYLFKAKRIDNGEWVQGYLFDDGFENGRMFVGGLVIEEYHGTACDDWSITGINFCEVDPSIICQCTGLKDKNGNLIWENDIMVAHLDKDNPEDITYAIVAWRENGWVTVENGSDDLNTIDDFTTENFEVVSTRFDNTELLEV